MTQHIPLRNKKRDIIVYAIIDASDYPLVKDHLWHLNISSHGCSSVRSAKTPTSKPTYLHRLIMADQLVGGKFVVDHINRNTLDNRRANLRLCTVHQNCMNLSKVTRKCSSRYKGVSLKQARGKWQAHIKYANKRYHLGYFDDEREAALAYDAKNRELFGDFASPNLPLP